jgi:hypothetical protein
VSAHLFCPRNAAAKRAQRNREAPDAASQRAYLTEADAAGSGLKLAAFRLAPRFGGALDAPEALDALGTSDASTLAK